MDILDVSDEELAPLQAFVDEGKDDRSGDGDMESDVEQVPEAPSAFLIIILIIGDVGRRPQ